MSSKDDKQEGAEEDHSDSSAIDDEKEQKALEALIQERAFGDGVTVVGKNKDDGDAAISKKGAAIGKQAATSMKDADSGTSVSSLSAADVPIPTELQRNETAPGAFAQWGRNAVPRPVEMRRSTTEPVQSPSSRSLNVSEPPLLAATLVVETESAHLRASSSTAPVALAVPNAVLAHAEPMEEAEPDDGRDKSSPPVNRGRRRTMIIAGILLLCVLLGAGTGGVVVYLGSTKSSKSDKSPQFPFPPPPSGDVEDDGADGDGGGDPNGLDRRIHYLVQWGTTAGGCKPPPNALVALICRDGGDVQILQANDNICTKPSRRRADCIMAPSNRGNNLRGRAEGDEDPNGFAPLQLAQGAMIVACDGISNDSLRLEVIVPLIIGGGNDAGVCDYILEEEESSANDGTTDRVYGGVLAAYVSTTMICMEADENSLKQVVATCEEGISVGSFNESDGEEQLPICFQPDTCREEATECTNDEADPCQGVSCRVEPDRVLVRAGGPIGRCSVAHDELGDEYLPETLWEFAEPYIIEQRGLERDLRVAAAVFFDQD
jgi:hypothetical protein